MNNDVLKLVVAYLGHNSFMNSLKSQAQRYGRLSPRQLECAERFFQDNGELASPLPQQVSVPKSYSYAIGEHITIRKWFANAKANELGLQFFFRNLIVESVEAETAKAVLIKVRFNSKVATCCHICGLNLDNEISQACGIGPVCAKRLGFKRVTMSDAAAVLARVEEESKIAGVIGPIWIPKRQLLSKAEQVLFDKE
jgi:hypothetical protein